VAIFQKFPKLASRGGFVGPRSSPLSLLQRPQIAIREQPRRAYHLTQTQLAAELPHS
jgi:hypothetical protein